jgi:hypothetical protein
VNREATYTRGSALLVRSLQSILAITSRDAKQCLVFRSPSRIVLIREREMADRASHFAYDRICDHALAWSDAS